MPMLQASAPDGANQEPGRLLHPGNALLRRAIQENLVSFPSQIPVFSRQARPEMQWKAVVLYFVRGWPLGDIAARFGVGAHRIARTVDEWATRAIALGYIQVIDPERFAAWSGAEEHTGADAQPAPGSAGSRSRRIYTISIFNPPANRKAAQLMEEQHGLLLLQELAERTGGLQFVVRGGEDMQQAAVRIGAALRNRYSIGYIPATGERSGQWRKIQVRVARAGLKVHARNGYRLD